MEQCTDDEVNRMLFLVSSHRRENALKFKFTFGKYACLKSAVMLQDMLTGLGITSKGEVVEFEYGEHGKPSLKGHPDVFFNISHCKNGIAVVVHDKPIGIDIESIRDADDALLRKTMNEGEYQAITSSADPATTFIQFWTQKEAVLKLRGTGIIDELHQVLSGKEQLQTHTNKEKKYVWSIATG